MLMSSIRGRHSRWPAVVLLSCILVLCLMAHTDAFDDHWSLLPVKRTDITQTEQRAMDFEGEKATEGKGRSGLSYKDKPVGLNVTDLVLNELRRGFFAAISENTASGSTLDSVVCVSEPTVLECQEAGFAALLLATLDHVSYCRMLGIHKVIYTAAVRANKYYSANPMNGEFTNDIDPIEIGSQVLIDILLLAKCGYFLHGESSVATLTSFFNPEMKLFFIGNLGKEVHSDGDFKENVLPVASTSEVEQDKELEEQAQSLTWYFKANGSYRTCPIMNKEQLIGPKKEDGDLKEKPFHVSSEDSEAEWEEGWDDQIQSLAWCFQANSLYSACPNMARGQLVDSKEVRTLLAQ
ncbi:uncharacterized protein LOC144665627 [Oculina patagonica]